MPLQGQEAEGRSCSMCAFQALHAGATSACYYGYPDRREGGLSAANFKLKWPAPRPWRSGERKGGGR